MEEINDRWWSNLDSLFWYNTGCSGLPDCDYCVKRMYSMRTTYTKQWFRLFIDNFDAIRDETMIQPKFIWHAGPNAKILDIESFIASHPKMDDMFRYFLKHIYNVGTSLGIIYELYKAT